MPAGRPRTVSLKPDEMIVLGKEMVEWVQKNNPLHLSNWYIGVKMFSYKQFKNYCDMPEFSPYYDKAINLVAQNYINGNIVPAIASRFLRIYFKDLKEQEDKDHDRKLEKELEKKIKEIDYEKSKNSDIPPLDDKVDRENELMELKSKLVKANKELEELRVNIVYN